MGSKTFFINGKGYTSREIGLEIKEALEDEFEDSVEAVRVELEKLVSKLKSNSSQRGRGHLAGEYNNPMKDAKVVVERPSPTTASIRVDSQVFNTLDQGRRAKRVNSNPLAPHYMTFPVYSGNATSPDSLSVGKVSVAEKPKWVRVQSVAAVQPRNFYDSVLKKKTYVRPPSKKNRSSNPFRFRFSPNDVKGTVNDRD